MTPRSGEIEGIKYEATRGLAQSAVLDWKMDLDGGAQAHPYASCQLYEAGMGHFLLAYDSPQARNEAEAAFDRLGHGMNEGVQFPGDGRVKFEYQGRHFLVITADQALTDQTDDCLYKGVVVEPNLYSERVPDSEDRVVEGVRESMRAIGQ